MDRHSKSSRGHRDRDYDRDRERDRDRNRDRDRHQYKDDKLPPPSSHSSSSSSKRQRLEDHESSSYNSNNPDKYPKSTTTSSRSPRRHSNNRRDHEDSSRDDRNEDRDRDRRQSHNNNNNNGREIVYNPPEVCPFGEKCYRQNFHHFKEYGHLHLESLLEEILKSSSSSSGSRSSNSSSSRIELPKNYEPKLDKTLILEQLNLLKSAGFKPVSESELRRRQDWATLFNPNSSNTQGSDDGDSQSQRRSYNNNNSSSSSRTIKREKAPVESEDSKYGKKLYSNPNGGGQDGGDGEGGEKEKEKEKPNFGLSGKLTEETNTFRGVVIKYSEPPEARKPQRIRWRLYPFKGTETLPTMFIHRQSAYLLGRERKIADIPIDHPSCSKQHAVIQYRLMPYKRKDGSLGRRIKPYIIDLESGNGTFVNGKQIESKRYVELFEKDVLKFGFSSREYVLLHEQSKDEPEDDEPAENSPEVDEKVRIKVEQEQD